MSTLSDIVAKFRKGSPNIAAAFDEVERRLVALENPSTPPPPSNLKWAQPSLDWPETILTTGGAERLDLSNDKDYVIRVDRKVWSGTDYGLHIVGGRNRIIDGGTWDGPNDRENAAAILVDGGNPAGTVWVNRARIDCANGITLRTKSKLFVQNSRIDVWALNDDPGIHADIIQVWDQGPCAGVYLHNVTGLTSFTGLSCLLAPDPVEWVCSNVNIKPHVRPNGNRDAQNYAWHNSGGAANAGGPFCKHQGDVYAELPTGGGGAYVRGIDDLVCARTASPLTVWPYEIKSPSGSVLYRSPDNPVGGSRRAEAKQAGNFLTFDRVPAFAGRRWIVGAPPNGDFCP